MRGFLWTVVVALVLFPVAYFALHWGDRGFRDSAIGNWFGTVIGVVVGVPVGFALATAQQKHQAEADRCKETNARIERLRSMRYRVYDELEHNSSLVKHLATVLSRSQTARTDLWGWAVQIAGEIEFEAYRDLDAVLLPEERGDYGNVALAYLDLGRLVGRVRESTAAHQFLLGYSANEGEANFRLAEAKAHTDIVESKLAPALASLRSS